MYIFALILRDSNNQNVRCQDGRAHGAHIKVPYFCGHGGPVFLLAGLSRFSIQTLLHSLALHQDTKTEVAAVLTVPVGTNHS